MNLGKTSSLSLCVRSSTHRGAEASIGTRRGFTLVELMITVTIMGILASVLLGALWKASITAKEMRTRSLIAKLNNHIIPRWESYRNRRLLFDPSLILNAQTQNNSSLLSPGQIKTQSQIFPIFLVWQPSSGVPLSRRHMQAIRLMAIREMMRLEMPERFQDITLNSSPDVQGSGTYIGPLIVPARTSMSQNYELKRLMTLKNSNNGLPDPRFESAECLYQIVTLGMEDGGLGQEHFSQADVGDRDGDGWPEFLDAWGNPIFFLRWAPHFYSILQPRWNPGADGVLGPNPNNNNINDDPNRATDQYFGLDPYEGVPDASGNMRGVADSAASHDPYDLMQDDHDAFALTPLIYSAGVDGIFDIVQGDFCVQGSQPLASRSITYDSPLNYFDPGLIYQYFANSQTSQIASQPPGTKDFYNPTGVKSYDNQSAQPPFAGGISDLSNDTYTSPGPANGRLNHADNIHNHVLGR